MLKADNLPPPCAVVTKSENLNFLQLSGPLRACNGTDLPFTYDGGGHAVAQLIEVLHYKPEGHGFDCRWCHWNFSLTQSFRPHSGHGVDSASNKNEYQEYFLRGKGGRCVGLTTIPLSCADCLDIWEPQPPGTLRDCYTFTSIIPPILHNHLSIYRGADKSLARPGRKQANVSVRMA